MATTCWPRYLTIGLIIQDTYVSSGLTYYTYVTVANPAVCHDKLTFDLAFDILNRVKTLLKLPVNGEWMCVGG